MGGIVSAGVEVATQVVEAIGSIASGIQALRILNISKDYYNLYKREKDFYYDTFQDKAETPLVNEILGIAVYNRDYAGRVAALYNSETGPFGGSSTDIQGWWERHCAMYGALPDDRIKELDVDMARLQSDWTNHIFRFEETWADLRNDSRWQKRLMAHNIGIKQGTSVTSALDGSMNQYQEHVQDLGNMLATYGNGIAAYAGYKKGLYDPNNNFATATEYSNREADATQYYDARIDRTRAAS
jgi:hypothetical protein